VIYQLDQ